MAPVFFWIPFILAKLGALRHCPFCPPKRVMPPGDPGGMFSQEHILFQVVPMVDPQLAHSAGKVPLYRVGGDIFGMLGIVWSQATADTLTIFLSLYVYRRYRPRLASEKHL